MSSALTGASHSLSSRQRKEEEGDGFSPLSLSEYIKSRRPAFAIAAGDLIVSFKRCPSSLEAGDR
jgi:hypothetical protein